MSDDRKKPATAANGIAASPEEQKQSGSKTPTSPKVAFDPVSSRKESLTSERDEEETEDDGVQRIEFYHRDAPHFWLSNSSDHAVVLDGIRYPTAGR